MQLLYYKYSSFMKIQNNYTDLCYIKENIQISVSERLERSAITIRNSFVYHHHSNNNICVVVMQITCDWDWYRRVLNIIVKSNLLYNTHCLKLSAIGKRIKLVLFIIVTFIAKSINIYTIKWNPFSFLYMEHIIIILIFMIMVTFAWICW